MDLEVGPLDSAAVLAVGHNYWLAVLAVLGNPLDYPVLGTVDSLAFSESGDAVSVGDKEMC